MRRLIAALMGLTLVLAACSGGDDAGDSLEATGTSVQSDDGDSDVSGREEGASEVDVSFEAVDERKVIRRASLQLHASETRAAFEEIISLVESAGGFVANARVHPFDGDEGAQPDIEMTLRVPADGLTSTINAIKEVADEVVSETQGAEDVTAQFVDLDARLRNLQALEVELRALLEEVRRQPDADPEKLLTVFNELSSVRGQIEQIEGQLNVLNDLTTLATLEVRISQTPQAAPIVDQEWQPLVTAREAVSSLVSSLQGVADWGINFALFVLPMLLLVVGIPAAIGYGAYRRFFQKGPPVSTDAAGPESS